MIESPFNGQSTIDVPLLLSREGIMKNIHITIIFFAAFFSIIFLLTAVNGANAESGESGIMAIGKAKILKNDIDAGKKSAVENALQSAVERAAVSMLSPSELSAGLEFIYNTTPPLTDKYIVTYKILGEIKQKDTYIVIVESNVATEKLKTLLTQNSIKRTKNNYPSIVFLISEQIPGEILPKYWWGNNPLPYSSEAEKALIEIMTNQNFRVAASGNKKPDFEHFGILFETPNDHQTALLLAGKLNADFVVMGQAVATENANIMADQKSYRATLSLKGYDVSSGEKIVSVEKEGAAKSTNDLEGITESLVLAGKQAGETLAPRLEHHWNTMNSKSSGPNIIETKIEGTDYLSSFIMLRKTLDDMSGIKDVQTKELSSDQAFVDILYEGDAKKLADALILKTFDSFGLELSQVTMNSLTIRFLPKDDVAPIKKSDMEGAYISE